MNISNDKYVRVKVDIASRVEIFRQQQGLSNFTEAVRLLVLRGLSVAGIGEISQSKSTQNSTPSPEENQEIDTSLMPEELLQNLFN